MQPVSRSAPVADPGEARPLWPRLEAGCTAGVSSFTGAAVSQTLRQSMAQLLRQGPLTARELAEMLLLTPREAEHHLRHLERSHKHRLRVEPARCRACGYRFRGRRRLDAPGRCPRCKEQPIDGPWFRLG